RPETYVPGIVLLDLSMFLGRHLILIMALGICFLPRPGWSADMTGMSDLKAQRPSPTPGMNVVRFSIDEALALFRKQNLDLLAARYGIENSKGLQITARLFPNPVLNIGTLSAMTQGQTIHRSGEIA